MIYLDFLDRYLAECDDLGIEPLPLPQLERLLVLLSTAEQSLPEPSWGRGGDDFTVLKQTGRGGRQLH